MYRQPNCQLQSNWVSLLHHRSYQQLGWGNTCLCTSTKNSISRTPALHLCIRSKNHTHRTLALRLCTHRTPHMLNSHLALHRHHIHLLTALRTKATMHSRYIHQLHTFGLHLGSTTARRLSTLDIHNTATLHQHHLLILYTLHQRKHNSTIHHLESQYIKHLWSHQPRMVTTHQCNTMTIRPHHYHHHPPARCQRPRSFTHDQLRFQVM